MSEANSREENSIFLYEVAFLNPKGFVAQRVSSVTIQVPKSRMSQETQRILRSGGKILSIKPLLSDRSASETSPPQNLPWWVEITTTDPKCLYYFGPFDSFDEALSSQFGYIEDLESESALGIDTQIKQCQPEILTLEDF